MGIFKIILSFICLLYSVFALAIYSSDLAYQQSKTTHKNSNKSTSGQELKGAYFNLAMYAGNNPINKADPSGRFEINVDFNGNRNKSATATVKDDFGNTLYSAPVLGLGKSNTDQWSTGGDTPAGSYRIGDVEAGGNWDKNKFGDTKIRLEPLSGVAKDSGRNQLQIHGGQSGSEKWGVSYNTNLNTRDRSDLRPTEGCLRMCNRDAAQVGNMLNEYRAYRNTIQYATEKLINDFMGGKTHASDTLNVK